MANTIPQTGAAGASALMLLRSARARLDRLIAVVGQLLSEQQGGAR